MALALLVCLQDAITWLSVRVPTVQDLVRSEPTPLLHEGRLLDGALKRQRVTQDEVRAALRQGGLDDPASARSVVLETDGSLTVIPR
ncbi:DUF421 domain-containing protein [Rhodobacter sp. CZR27]|uniref:DUF421 domain-containing protein n=1 Tax=Rhodobacter sp. CZR27 TaxID=2033869 RepID=UPI0037441F18